MKDKELIDEQLDYYRARAPEYDQWFLRQGRYDRGPQHRAEWFREVSNIENALRPIVEGKSIAELACGTGLWTERLVRWGARVLAVDAAPEAIDLNKQRLGSLKADYCVADIFTWSSTANRQQLGLRELVPAETAAATRQRCLCDFEGACRFIWKGQRHPQVLPNSCRMHWLDSEPKGTERGQFPLYRLRFPAAGDGASSRRNSALLNG